MSLSEKLREHEGKKLGGPQMKRLLCCASHRRETLGESNGQKGGSGQEVAASLHFTGKKNKAGGDEITRPRTHHGAQLRPRSDCRWHSSQSGREQGKCVTFGNTLRE